MDHYSDLSSGLQWLEGKRQGKGHKRSKKERRRGSQGFGKAETSMEESFVFPSGLAEDEEEDEVISKLQVRAVGVAIMYGECYVHPMCFQRDLGIRDLESYFKEEDEEKEKNFSEDFTQFKVYLQH